jgi:hypothetical protein
MPSYTPSEHDEGPRPRTDDLVIYPQAGPDLCWSAYGHAMDELAERIAARLHEAIDRQIAGGFYPNATRGLVDERDPDADYDVRPKIRLSVEDVARIAADEARR